jgi:hypothetical protein
MGLIKNLVGALLGLVKTLFTVLLGLVGVGKKSEYFLELDESAASAPTPVAPPQAEVASAPEPQATEKVAQPAAPAMAAKSSQADVPDEGGLTFATDFLVNPRLNNTSRRRPGPSLSPFTSMVKDMKRAASMG